MAIHINTLFKIILISLLFIYLLETTNINTMTFDATLTLIVSFYWLIKNRENNLLYIGTIFIFYCIYSIVVGEYFIPGRAGVPMTEVNITSIYALLIRILLVFMFIISVFTKKVSRNSIKMRYIDNPIIFYILNIVLLLIFVFGVNRSLGSSYTVNISSIYEYSYTLFLFAYYSSGNKKFKKIFLSGILILFILQDFYLGGRITALQLLIVLLFTMADDFLNSRMITIGSIGGIVVGTIVALYRTTYSFVGINLMDTIKGLIDNLFVFSTATYAYYASATHVASIEFGLAGMATRLRSFWEFFKSIFFGGNELIGNVTKFVDVKFFANIGGGVFPTHFYFWFGWAGIVISGFIVVFMINHLIKKGTDLSILLLSVIVISSPRWFLYNPLLFFRTQLIVALLYVIYKISHVSLMQTFGKRKVTNIESIMRSRFKLRGK